MPFRGIKSHAGQPNLPGWYWSATTGGLIPYDSRLELANLILIDHDSEIRWIYAQPFQMMQRSRKHVPDFLLVGRDDSMIVVDVKPLERLNFRRNPEIFAWCRVMAETMGWKYQIMTEPDPCHLENVRFLAGYRRSGPYATVLLKELSDLAKPAMPFTSLCQHFSKAVGLDVASAKPYLFHALWTHLLAADFAKPLGPLTEVWTPEGA